MQAAWLTAGSSKSRRRRGAVQVQSSQPFSLTNVSRVVPGLQRQVRGAHVALVGVVVKTVDVEGCVEARVVVVVVARVVLVVVAAVVVGAVGIGWQTQSWQPRSSRKSTAVLPGLQLHSRRAGHRSVVVGGRVVVWMVVSARVVVRGVVVEAKVLAGRVVVAGCVVAVLGWRVVAVLGWRVVAARGAWKLLKSGVWGGGPGKRRGRKRSLLSQ